MGLLDDSLELRREASATLRKDAEIIARAWELLQAKDPSIDIPVGFGPKKLLFAFFSVKRLLKLSLLLFGQVA